MTSLPKSSTQSPHKNSFLTNILISPRIILKTISMMNFRQPRRQFFARYQKNSTLYITFFSEVFSGWLKCSGDNLTLEHSFQVEIKKHSILKKSRLRMVILNSGLEFRDHKTFEIFNHDLNLKRNTHWGALRAKDWFFSLHRNPDSLKFSRNQTSPVSPSVSEFHFFISHRTVSFFFIKASIKNYLVSVIISMRILSTFFLASEN